MSTNRYIDKLKARLAKEADQRMQLQALLDDQVARNRALLAERDALAKDAERYRFLMRELGGSVSQVVMGSPVFSNEDVNAAIDAALQGAQP